jgi:hypothetical protein
MTEGIKRLGIFVCLALSESCPNPFVIKLPKLRKSDSLQKSKTLDISAEMGSPGKFGIMAFKCSPFAIYVLTLPQLCQNNYVFESVKSRSETAIKRLNRYR